MSKLDELLQGVDVEWLPLRDVAEYVRGLTYNKNNESKVNTGYKVLRANNITLSNNSLNFDDIKYINFNTKVKDNQKLYKYDILISAASGSRDHVGKVAYIDSDLDYYFGGFMGVVRCSSKIISKYLFYILTSDIFKRYIDNALNTATINNLSSSVMNAFKFPIPYPNDLQKSLEIQQEIVRVLDELTSLTNQLTTELETERQSRKKQFEFFREQMLRFDINSVERKKLGDIAKIYDGTHSTPKYKESGIPFVSVQNINNLYATNKYISLEDFEKYKHKPKKNDVFMTRIGSIGVCSIVENNEPLAYYVTLALIRLDLGVINQNYFKHVIESNIGKSELFKRTLVNATPIKINLGEISKINLPIPPLAEQERIVKLLDQFDATHTAIEEEITKEIKLRTQQYEYYREKLLSFPQN